MRATKLEYRATVRLCSDKAISCKSLEQSHRQSQGVGSRDYDCRDKIACRKTVARLF